MLPPWTPIFARASRFGFLAVSSSVLPPGVIGKPPRPSATSITILESFLTCSSRVRAWMSIGGFRVQGSGFRSFCFHRKCKRRQGPWRLLSASVARYSFLSDLNPEPRTLNPIPSLTWLGHASWQLKTDWHTILVDPFLDDSPTAPFKAQDAA